MSSPDHKRASGTDDYLNQAFGATSAAPAAPLSWQQIYLSLNGRIPRRVFWLYGVLGLLGAAIVLMLVLRTMGLPERTAEIVLALALFWPSLAVQVKRWHDQDRSGWWVLIGFIPLVGWLIALSMNGFIASTPGDNRFGAMPAGTN